MIPARIYAIQELSSVGMTEAQARDAHGDVLVDLQSSRRLHAD